MPGELVTLDIGAMIRARAAIERDRITLILDAIEERRAAGIAAMDDTLSEAGEYLAVARLDAAEARLVQLILNPGFVIYQRHLLKNLAEIAAGAA